MEKGRENQSKKCVRETQDCSLLYESPLSPARQLLVWEKWIQIRKEETMKLGKKLNRPPADLTMNLPEKVREDLERKTALEYAQIQKKPTTFGGTLFEPPQKLKQCCYCAPLYEVHRTRAELGHPRMIEHVGIPTYIQKTELGMAGEPERVVCHHLNAEYKSYRDKREKELKKRIRKIDPFRPSTSQLIIKGSKPKTPPPKIPTPPSISLDDPANDPIDSIFGVYAVKINNTVFYKETPGLNLTYFATLKQKIGNESCKTWTYYFNAPAKRVGRGKLFLQNIGTMTLRYCWKKIKRQQQFIPNDMYEQVFFFNKNEDVLSPGQIREVCFTFISNTPSIHSEEWELCFSNVDFLEKANEKLIIDLHADAVENAETMKAKVELLKSRIQNKTVYNLCKELIEEVFDTVFAIVPQSYPYKKYFIEEQIFVMKNPVCFYHQTEVKCMKEMYERELEFGHTWDLSIGTWRHAMMAKEFDDRMKYFTSLKKSHSECLKPWYEGEPLLTEKYRAMNNLWGLFADNLDKEYEHITNDYTNTNDIASNTNISTSQTEVIKDPQTMQLVRNIFFMRAYDHLASTIELCAGILSSLDSNKWIEFDFCSI